MGSCCEQAACEASALQGRQRRVLYWVLGINTVMFAVEFSAGWWAHSTALLGDSLDMLGDALAYGVSIFVLARGALWRARAATVKGTIMAVFGVTVLAEAIGKSLHGAQPVAAWMGGIAVLALGMNAICLLLLTRHRDDDVNMRSSWVCSRNDLLANTAVIAAAALVSLTGSAWPDVAVGVGIAMLFLGSARSVLSSARRERTRLRPASAEHGA